MSGPVLSSSLRRALIKAAGLAAVVPLARA